MTSFVCNICRSYLRHPINHQYAICKNCGHVYQPRTQEDEYYHNLPCSFPKDYEQHAIRRADYIMDFVRREYKRPIRKVLDVGCGPGAVLDAIQKQLPDAGCYGCTLGKSNNPKIYSIDIEKDYMIDDDFDLIILSHVAEHFFSPISTMKRIGHLLSPVGTMYLEVPSFHWVEVRTRSIFTPEHMSYFTPNSLLNVVLLADLVPSFFKESRYWGNIKMLCYRSSQPLTNTIKKVDYRRVLGYHRFVKFLYPWYRLVKHVRKVGPNE